MKTITFNGTTYTCPFFGVVPRLSPVEERELREDIEAHGVLIPVVVSEDSEVIDGFNRLTMAVDLGLADVPLNVVTDLTAERKKEMAADLNLHRRQLSQRQKQEVVERKLKADPSRSNRAIAAAVGVTDKTVGATRAKLERTAEIPQSVRREGQDGRTRPVVKSVSTTEPAPTPPAPGRTRGRSRGPYPWWPELATVGREAARLAEALLSLGRLSTDDRTVAPVQKIADQFRQLADHLEEMVADSDGSTDCRNAGS